jgi:hypothetical protein
VLISIPLTVGRGLSTLEDIRLLLEAGADKVSMNGAAVKRPYRSRKLQSTPAPIISPWRLMPVGTAQCFLVGAPIRVDLLGPFTFSSEIVTAGPCGFVLKTIPIESFQIVNLT